MTNHLMTKKTDQPDLNGHASVKLDLKAAGEDGSFEGYGAVFGNLDGHYDIIQKGAFLVSLDQHKSEGTMPALLWQHQPDNPVGYISEIKEDDQGLHIKGQIDLNTQQGKEAHSLLKSGAISGLSIGYRTVRAERSEDGAVRLLKELDVWEVSFVTFPSNASARVSGVKSETKFAGLETLRDCEKHLRDEGGLTGSAATAMVGRIKRIVLEERDAQEAAKSLKKSQEWLAKLMES